MDEENMEVAVKILAVMFVAGVAYNVLMEFLGMEHHY